MLDKFSSKIQKQIIVLLFSLPSFLLANQPSWLDLPKDSLTSLSYLKNEETSEIDKLISEYHFIPKTDPLKILERIVYLKTIEQKLFDQITPKLSKKNKKFLKNIYETAKEKRIYLENLENLRFNLTSNQDYLNHYFYDISKNCDNWIPLFLCNQRKYDSTLRIYWGEYILGVLDPCHRFLTTYFDLWRQIDPENLDYFLFFIWLEGQNVPFDITRVYFFTEEEKNAKEIVQKQGKLCLKITDDFFSSSQKECLFIIDLEEKIFVTEGTREIRHDSLSLGKPVIAAGNIIIQEGVIIRLGLESGHYQPTILHGIQLLTILRKKGIPLSSDIKIDFYHDNTQHSLCLKDFELLHKSFY